MSLKPNRDAVENDIAAALVSHDLAGYTDGVMDSLDTVVEWADENEEEDDDEG